MTGIRTPASLENYSTVILAIILAILCVVSSLESDISQDFSRNHPQRLVPIDNYPRNYYPLYHDMETWKRAPSAGFYGMRGKKVPNLNSFLGRGKKGPSGFLGMRGRRGKKADTSRQLQLSSELSPAELENIWMPDGFIGRPVYTGQDSYTDALLEDPLQIRQNQMNHREPEREDELLLQHPIDRNLGQINV